MLETWPALFAALGTLMATQAGAQVHRCTLPDGRVVYSDRPCDGSTLPQQRAVPQAPRPAPAAAPAPRPPAAAHPRAGAATASATAAVQWTGSQVGDLARAAALIDLAEMRGKDCQWVIKVTRENYAVCDQFQALTQPDGAVHQATRKLQELAQDARLRQTHMAQLRRAAAAAQRVIELREFVRLAR